MLFSSYLEKVFDDVIHRILRPEFFVHQAKLKKNLTSDGKVELTFEVEPTSCAHNIDKISDAFTVSTFNILCSFHPVAIKV